MCGRAGIWAVLLCGLSCDGAEDSEKDELDSAHMDSGGADDTAVIDARDEIARLMDEGSPSYSGVRGATPEGGLLLAVNWSPDGDLEGRAYLWESAAAGDESLALSTRIVETGEGALCGVAPMSSGRIAFSKYGEGGTLEITTWSASDEVDATVAFEAPILTSGDLSGDGVLDLVAPAGTPMILGREVMVMDGNERGDLTWEDRMAGIVMDSDGEALAVTVVNDADGDGFDELQVQAAGGRALVFRGPVMGDLLVDDADASITGLTETVTGPHRYAPASVGDFDGDGLADVAFWAEEQVDVLIFGLASDGVQDGAEAIASLTVAEGSGDVQQPFNMVGGVDLDADGKADLLVPWLYTDDARGAAFLWFVPGGQRGSVAADEVGRSMQYSWFGEEYAGVGSIADLGDDGVPDVAVPGSSAANILSSASIINLLGEE